MRKTLVSAVAIASVCSLLLASVAVAGPFSRVFVFGDSRSDTGNLAEFQGANFPTLERTGALDEALEVAREVPGVIDVRAQQVEVSPIQPFVA